MAIPQWLLSLDTQKAPQLLLHFPYTGNNVYATLLERDSFSGYIVVEYEWQKNKKEDLLRYDNYTQDPDSFDNWFAYPVGGE